MSSLAAGHPPATSPAPASDADGELAALRRALVGQYDVERLLGAGGMGSVYLGRDRTLDRPVAIKVIAPEMAVSPVVRERFLREARTVARLRHPNIVTVHAAGQARGALFFVMEYVPGESLRDRLARDRTVDADDAVRVLHDLARALGYAHAQGVVHRDVKPENVLLDATSGRAMLTDFGVAALVDPGRDADGRVTGTGLVLGSPRYMSPEQAGGDPSLDGRSDLYALGLVGYEMFAGAPAIDGPSAPAIMMRQLMERPPALGTRSATVPAPVAAALMRAIEKAPEDRWPTGDAMADALGGAAAAAGVTGSRAPATRWTRWTRRTRVAIAAAAVAVVGAGGWLAAREGGPPRGVDPRRSYLVAPFAVLGPDAAQQAWLREGAVGMLALDLAQWRDLQVVDYERVLDLQRDLDVDAVRAVGLEDALRMARRAGVWTVVTGQVTATSDSLLVDARVVDVASGRRIESAHQGIARGADPRPLFDALARDLLNLVGAPPVTLALAQSTTSSVEAYRHYLEAVRAMNAWQLARADTLFDAATRADSTFALAYYKRALALSWRDKSDSLPNAFLQRAVQHAGRLPARERALLDGYRAFDLANEAAANGDPSAAAQFATAQRKYAEVIARDSGDAEAWFGLADAYFHDLPPTGFDTAGAARWTRALAAFDRTLTLDSSFHLAYWHKIDMYETAARSGSPLLLDGETLRIVRDEAVRPALGPARMAAGRARARALALRDARAWVALDPVPESWEQLARVFEAAGQHDSAAAALAEGARRAPVRGSTTLPFQRALYLARVSPTAAYAALGTALAEADVGALRQFGGADRFPLVLRAAAVAGMFGDLRGVDSVARLAYAVEPTPFNSAVPTRRVAEMWAATLKLAMGAPARPLQTAIDAGIAATDRQPSALAASAALGSIPVPYVAYAVTREPRYLAALRRWRAAAPDRVVPLAEIDALEALRRGDTTRARTLAATFPSADSARASGAPIAAARWIVRAEVLTALGEPRRALAAYEVLDPARLLQSGFLDPALALYARSFLARGRLHEQLGQRAEAAAVYARFLSFWKGADPAVQDQAREATAGLLRSRDGGR